MNVEAFGMSTAARCVAAYLVGVSESVSGARRSARDRGVVAGVGGIVSRVLVGVVRLVRFVGWVAGRSLVWCARSCRLVVAR